MSIVISPEKLAEFEALVLHVGNHKNFEQGHCAMEVVSWLADEGFTDAPQCASPVLRRYAIALNDRWDHDKRQTLKPYLLKMIGTGGDGKDAAREQVAAEFLSTRLLGPWLELAGIGDHLVSIEGKSGGELRDALWVIREAAWAKRRASRTELKAKIKARLIEQGNHAVDAAAVVDAAAAAAAVDVVVGAVVDAAAVAAAVVAADVVDAAVVDAAVAAAAAVADADPYARYNAAYAAARKYYDENPLPIMAAINDLEAKQQPLALKLLDAMIEVGS